LALALMARGAFPDDISLLRHQMVEEQIRQRGITDPPLLSAMDRVPRHLFVPGAVPADAYADRPLPFGPKGKWGTIYQPYVVALMTDLLELTPRDKVLEIGTGSGYHAAVLSRLAREVYSVEISQAVADQAARRLALLGFANVLVRVGDGYQGWPEHGPFDAILLSIAPPEIPKPLLDQLKKGGRLVAPIGDFFQDLQVITKRADGTIEKRTVSPVRLAPMTGKVRDGQNR
jgi:protein-L-isoaspartate(D-aspartate) O-methyltransferase